MAMELKRPAVEAIIKTVTLELVEFVKEHKLQAATLLVPCTVDSSANVFRVLAFTPPGNLFEYERIPARRFSGPWPSVAAYAAKHPGQLVQWQENNEQYCRFPVFDSDPFNVGAFGFQQPHFVLEAMVPQNGSLPPEKKWRDLATALAQPINKFNDDDPGRYILNLIRSDGDSGGVVCTDLANSSALFRKASTRTAITAIRSLSRLLVMIAKENGGGLLTSSGDGCVFIFPTTDDQPLLSGSIAAINAGRQMLTAFENNAEQVLTELSLIPDELRDGTVVDRNRLEELLAAIRIRISVAAGVWVYSSVESPFVSRAADGGPLHRAGYLNQAMRSLNQNALWIDEFAYNRATAFGRNLGQGFSQVKESVTLKSGIKVTPWAWDPKNCDRDTQSALDEAES